MGDHELCRAIVVQGPELGLGDPKAPLSSVPARNRSRSMTQRSSLLPSACVVDNACRRSRPIEANRCPAQRSVAPGDGAFLDVTCQPAAFGLAVPA